MPSNQENLLQSSIDKTAFLPVHYSIYSLLIIPICNTIIQGYTWSTRSIAKHAFQRTRKLSVRLFLPLLRRSGSPRKRRAIYDTIIIQGYTRTIAKHTFRRMHKLSVDFSFSLPLAVSFRSLRSSRNRQQTREIRRHVRQPWRTQRSSRRTEVSWRGTRNRLSGTSGALSQ